MASTTTTDVNCTCGPCFFNSITVPAKVWCLSCEEGICQLCTNSHKGIKATRNHKVIPAEKCHHVASIGHLMSQTCKNHNKIIDLYCPLHDAPVCSLCISENHRECKDIVSLDEVAKNVVSSSSFCNLEQNIENLFKNLSDLKAERERNFKHLQSDKVAKNTLVKEMRRKLNERLDALEENLLQELSSKVGACKTEINNSLSEIESKTKAVYAIQSNFSQLKETATDVQMFLAIREIDGSLTKKTNWLHEITNQHKINELTLDLDTKPMEELLEQKLLGSFRIDRSRNHVPINHPSIKETQIPLGAMRYRVDQIRLQQKIYIPFDSSTLYDQSFRCMICSNGDIILVDGKGNKLALFNENGTHIKNIPVPLSPCDITEISQDRIAITYGNAKKFEIVDTKDYKYKIVESVPTTSTCLGISFDNGKLAAKCAYEGIHIYDIIGQKIMNIQDNEINGGLHLIYSIAMSHGRIYYTYYYQNTMNCRSLDGGLIRKYQCDFLQGPTGITTDGYGNVYVVGQQSKILMVISEDGRNGRDLFRCKATPRSLHFDKHNNWLLVRDYVGATVYDVVFGQ